MKCRHKSVRWVDKECRTTWKSFGAVTAQCVACMVVGVRSMGESNDDVPAIELAVALNIENAGPDHPHHDDISGYTWQSGIICSDASAFVDGELGELDAKCFRMHLPNCVECRQLVGFVVVTDAVLSSEIKETP